MFKERFIIGCKNIRAFNECIKSLDTWWYARKLFKVTDTQINTADGSIEIYGYYRKSKKYSINIDAIFEGLEEIDGVLV